MGHTRPQRVTRPQQGQGHFGGLFYSHTVPRFTYINNFDDSVQYYMDDQPIAYVDHDTDGWNGMERIHNVIKAIAEKLDTTLEEVQPTDDEE